MSDLVEKSFYDESTDSLVVKTSYDNRAVLAQNADQRKTRVLTCCHQTRKRSSAPCCICRPKKKH